MRSFLTLLGIVIGITSIILMMSIGQSAQNLILSQIQGLGSKTIVVLPGREPTGPSDFSQILSDSLKEKDVLLLKQNIPDISQIMPIVFGGETGVFENNTYRLSIFGASNLISKIFDLYPEKGTFFSAEDIKNKADVAVIGSKVKDKLFGSSDALNQKIKIKDRNFRVVGVLPKKGQVSFFNFDEVAIVPYTTAQNYIFGIKYFHRIIIETKSEALIPQTVEQIKTVLRNSHNIPSPDKDDFFIQTQADLAQRVAVVTNMLTLLLVSIAAISLVVGGIGIMNIMLVSVTERTREIGLRKAVGASNRDILFQFLFEAVLLTAMGGIAGIVLGGLLSLASSIILSQVFKIQWTFAFPILPALISLTVSAIIGLVFGIYPAKKASNKSPIEALRYE